jgi:ATP-dependent RNA helicase DeaD
VLDTITKEDLSTERALIQGMGEGHNLETIAAAALRIAFGEQLHGSDHDPIINSINAAARGYQTAPASAPRGNGDKPFRPQDRESVRLWLDIGREKGIRAGDIVGAIANEANIPGRLIGSIELHDGFSYVSVPSRDARKVIDVLNRATIRGHKVRANIVVAKKGN